MRAPKLREKVRKVLVAARDRDLGTDAQLDAFLDEVLRPGQGTFGGDTSCVQLFLGQSSDFICDSGTGLRVFGHDVLAQHGPGAARSYHIFLSHLHWDHILGFPFFPPNYLPGNKVVVHGCHREIEQAFRTQCSYPGFPVTLEMLRADVSFVYHPPGEPYDIEGVTIRTIPQHHSGVSYGYRFEAGGKSVVFSTDSEHKSDLGSDEYPFLQFIRDADLMIFDAQYTLSESILIKEDWGHSSNIVGVELAQRGNVKRLCMYHHEPLYDDEKLLKIEQDTREYAQMAREGAGSNPAEIMAAYDGLIVEL